MKLNTLIALVLSIPFASAASAQQIGEVDTAFKLIGPDHKIVVEAFDDPKVAGITCYVSRSKAGGLTGALGLATEKSESSIACRQVGPISSTVPIPRSEEVFSESRSILFKKMRIVRMVDPARQVLLYLTYSDKLIDGSPKNSLTAVPLNGAKLQFK
ncbi:MAG: CreA family protein [Burkholderiales bacterium]|jgi:CreA protein|nr:CreA family protein [Burkholderiales bacterium]